MKPGERFKKFRESKGLKVSETAEGIVSPQFLRKFEKGESDIRFTNLMKLLSRMQLTMEEFIYEEEEFLLDNYLRKFEEKIDTAIKSNNSFLLLKIVEECKRQYIETKNQRYYLLGLAADYYYCLMFRRMKISSAVDFLAEITNYLIRVESWGRFELYLVTLTGCHMLSIDELYYRSKKYLKEAFENTINSKVISEFLVHAAYELGRKKSHDLGFEIIDSYLDRIDEMRDTHYIHYDLFAIYVKGLLLVDVGKLEGEKVCRRIIDIFADDLGYIHYANHLHTGLQLVLDSLEEK